MLTTTSADGTQVRAHDEGDGPSIVLVGPGMDDGTRTRKLAARLSHRFRVLRLHRRQYRLDLKAAGACTVAQEVEDVLALARVAGEPVVLYGHSSGGVVALEALAFSPAAFAGAVIFEPAVVIDAPLSGEGGHALQRARTAWAEGSVRRAADIFYRETIGLPPSASWLAAAFTALHPHYRRLVGCQLDDLEALDRLGVRLGAYSALKTPLVLMGGDRSPAHLTERIEAVAGVLPHAERVVMRGRDHGADLKHSGEVAEIIAALAVRVLHR
ncbi:alpha/beta hydrolase [Nonomuraea sp. NPDC048881]|uniref:alpha/beta fold hydrolase n=1 Tax=Nonomuraea sp. NPDC048881 TaxID=3155030 RepID=UPI003400C680